MQNALTEAHRRHAGAVFALARGPAIEPGSFDRYTYREVARLLGEPEGPVKSRIRSGLHRRRPSSGAGLVGTP